LIVWIEIDGKLHRLSRDKSHHPCPNKSVQHSLLCDMQVQVTGGRAVDPAETFHPGSRSVKSFSGQPSIRWASAFISMAAYDFGILLGTRKRALRTSGNTGVCLSLESLGARSAVSVGHWAAEFLTGIDWSGVRVFTEDFADWWTVIALMALHQFGVWSSFFAWNWALATAVCVGIAMMLLLSRWGDILFGGIGAFGRSAFIGVVFRSPRILSGLGLGHEDRRPVEWESASIDEFSLQSRSRFTVQLIRNSHSRKISSGMGSWPSKNWEQGWKKRRTT